jgi:iduronate 2-sulfatase
MIIAAPGITEPGTASNSIVELVDLYPTLLELCSLRSPGIPGRLDGVSLKPILDNPNANVKTNALSQIARPLGGREDLEIIGSSFRDDRYRYNVWRRKTDGEIIAEGLYDLSDDLYNAENLIDDSNYRYVRNRMLDDLKSMLNK